MNENIKDKTVSNLINKYIIYDKQFIEQLYHHHRRLHFYFVIKINQRFECVWFSQNLLFFFIFTLLVFPQRMFQMWRMRKTFRFG